MLTLRVLEIPVPKGLLTDQKSARSCRGVVSQGQALSVCSEEEDALQASRCNAKERTTGRAEDVCRTTDEQHRYKSRKGRLAGQSSGYTCWSIRRADHAGTEYGDHVTHNAQITKKWTLDQSPRLSSQDSFRARLGASTVTWRCRRCKAHSDAGARSLKLAAASLALQQQHSPLR